MRTKWIFLTLVVLGLVPVTQAALADLTGTSWTGYMGGGDPSALLVENSGGELMMASQGSFWNPDYDDSPGQDYGPFLFIDVTGDFIATTRVTGFAGAMGAQVFHNYGGIQARTPGGEISNLENIVQIGYFPTWTGHIAWNTVNNNREESGFTVPYWVGDSYATAAQYSFLQIERLGNYFYYRISSDGTNWIPLVEENVLYDGEQTPVIKDRADMPATLQLGLYHGMASFDPGGFIKFDFFEVSSGGNTIFSDDFSADHMFIPEPATMTLLGMGILALRRRK